VIREYSRIFANHFLFANTPDLACLRSGAGDPAPGGDPARSGTTSESRQPSPLNSPRRKRAQLPGASCRRGRITSTPPSPGMPAGSRHLLFFTHPSHAPRLRNTPGLKAHSSSLKPSSVLRPRRSHGSSPLRFNAKACLSLLRLRKSDKFCARPRSGRSAKFAKRPQRRITRHPRTSRPA
jgi:hypothetical protein